MLHRCGNNSTSFSILFPMPGKQPMEEGISTNHTHPSSSVDCTLSLGTPSTRHNPSASSSPTPIQRSSCTSSFCWDIISQSNKHAVASSRLATAPTGNSSNLGGDPLHLARRCANCDTTSTPLWRNGPRGPKSLCNACGIRYKKEERRAAASSASPSTIPVNEAMGYSFQPPQQQQHPWSCNPSTGTKSTYEEFRMGRDQMVVERPSWCQNVEDDDTEVPYLSWRLNVGPPHFPVTDRPSVFQYQL